MHAAIRVNELLLCDKKRGVGVACTIQHVISQVQQYLDPGL